MDDLRQVKHMLALADMGNFGRAAEFLGITKSALSQSISRIEDLYGVSLFDRGRNGAKPTIYGEMLIAHARKGLAVFESARRELVLTKTMETGRLIIGSDPVTAEVLLAPALVEIVKAFPRLQFTLRSGFWSDCKEQLDHKELDLYIGIKPDLPIHGFGVTDFLLPPIVVYCRSGHPLTKVKHPRMSDYYQYPVLGSQMPEWFYQRVNKALGSQENQYSPLNTPFLLCNDEGALRAIVRESDALSGSFHALIEREIEAGSLQVLAVENPEYDAPIPCVVVAKERRLLPPSAGRLSQIVLDIATRLLQRHNALRQRSVEGGGRAYAPQ